MLGYKGSGLLLCVCVLLLSGSSQCRSMESRGRPTGSHSPLQCATVQPGKNKRARQKRGRKEGSTCVKTNPSGAVFHLPLIYFKGKFLVCVCVCLWPCGTLLLLFCVCMCFFFFPSLHHATSNLT